jgi:hypothetical protein
VVESSVNLMTRNPPMRPGAVPATDRPLDPRKIPGSELLERTIARIQREFGGFVSRPLTSERSAQTVGTATTPHHPSSG